MNPGRKRFDLVLNLCRNINPLYTYIFSGETDFHASVFYFGLITPGTYHLIPRPDRILTDVV